MSHQVERRRSEELPADDAAGVHPDDHQLALVRALVEGRSAGVDLQLVTLLAESKRAKAIKTLPIWAFHGAKDPVVKLEESQRMVDAVKRAGGDAKLTVYPEAQHDSWTETYNDPELFAWFLQQQRPAK